MPILKRLQSYLDTNKIPYEVVSHPKAYTAHDVAQTLDVPGKLVAKVVVVKADSVLRDERAPVNLARGPETIARCTGSPRHPIGNGSGDAQICSPIAKWERCRRSAISTAWKCMSISS